MAGLADLSERKILITGASSGIGRAAAVLAASLGASVVLCGRDKTRLDETLSMLEQPERHISLSFDVRDFECYDSVFAAAVADGKKLDGMVHCAGEATVTPVRTMNHDVITRVLETNLSSFIMLTSFYSKRKYSSGGSIVGISSANSHIPQKCMSVYAASKAALEACVKTMALELSAQNIRINCVVPGAVDTPMAGNVDEETLLRIERQHLLGMSAPESIANFIVFLLSNASCAVTGRAIWADGGMLGQAQ